MYGNKFQGDIHSFTIQRGTLLGTGGNGSVFEVQLDGCNPKERYAVKIFNCSENLKEEYRKERYARFCQEIDFLCNKGKNIEGIIPIIDKHIPDQLSEEDVPWYLMPKAEQYDFRENRSLKRQLQDMLMVANTLRILHTLPKPVAHRDIKPKNLLLFKGRLCLCDFGLIWVYGDGRLTFRNEPIGPIQIMPPELEPVYYKLDLLYTFSDVYLFAKTLWMLIKKDGRYGFKGPYQRKRTIIYLQREDYNVSTLEPIHQLLEKATMDEMNKRINIDECIKLMELQLEIIDNEGNREELWNKKKQSYIYQENVKKIIEEEIPDKSEYTDENIVKTILDGVIGKSFVYLIDEHDQKRIDVSEYELVEGKRYRLYSFYDEQIREEYYIQIDRLRCDSISGEIELILMDINNEDKTKDNQERVGKHKINVISGQARIKFCMKHP